MRSTSIAFHHVAVDASSHPMTHKNPVLRVLRPCLLATLVAMLFVACGDDVVREAGTYDDGARAYEREYLVTPDAGRVPHGAHATWHAGGGRRTLEFYRNGVREGYAFEWNEAGELARLQACEAGVCEERTLPSKAGTEGTMLAARTSD